MDGMSSNFQSANAAMLQMSNYANLPPQPPPQQSSVPELTPQKKAVFERLKKRVNMYRKRQADIVPRFEQNFTNICEQQSIETNLLQKKFLESKAKRVAKKTDKKQVEGVGSGIVSKAQKRPTPDDLENDPDLHQQPSKIPNNQQQSSSIDSNMKFQVEIVQQLEFTTNVANMQPQQISTNVTVKTTTNGSLTTKYEPQEMKQKMNEPAKMQPMAALPPAPPDILQDFKQEPDNEFADLDFGGIANFMANDENELKKLFSNISEVFDQSDLFDDTKHIKQEPMMKPQLPQIHQQPHQLPPMIQSSNNSMQMGGNQFNQYVMQDNTQLQMKQQMMQQQTMQAQQPMRMYQQQPQQQQPQPQIPDITPAAQTLKNMAQQHQVKSSMAMNYMRPQMQQHIPPQQQQQQQQPMMNSRMPAYQQNYDTYNFNQLKQPQQMNLPFTPDMIKQELLIPQQQQQQQPLMGGMNMKPMMNHQMMHQEEPKMHQNYQNFQSQQQQQQFMAQQQPQQRNFNQGQNMNIHMKQTQMMHIQQQGNMAGSVQMQGGQHMGMSMNDGSFNMQQQQNMYFNQQHHTHQPNTHPTYAMQLQQQKRQQQQQQQQHHAHGQGPHVMGEGPTNTYNMMQSQSMSFTQ